MFLRPPRSVWRETCAPSSRRRRLRRQERQPRQMPAGDEQRAAADAEDDDDQQRAAEHRVGRRGRRDREREHRDRVDHPERHDRQDDRVDPDADPAELPQHPDLDQVVEPERQDHAARGRGADRREAAGLVGALVRREQPVPGAGAEDEADEVGERRGRDEPRPDVLRAASSSAVSRRATRTDAAIVSTANSALAANRRRNCPRPSGLLALVSRSVLAGDGVHRVAATVDGHPGGAAVRIGHETPRSRSGHRWTRLSLLPSSTETR